MNPICFKVPRLSEETVRVESWDLPYFYNEVHYHEECQLTYILEGEGILLVGEKMEEFSPGDLIIIGKNTPHVLRHNKDYYESDKRLHARAISIFFPKDSFSKVFDFIPETNRIGEFLEQAKFGIRIQNLEAKKILPYIRQMVRLKKASRIALFLKILDIISRSSEIRVLTDNIKMVNGTDDGNKLNKVFDYIVKNFDKKITLEEVASIVYLSPTAFCRFFKHRTNKTFSRFLIEVRIDHACKMLSKGNYNVTETLFSCGYNNSSNFHRHFRQFTGLTPSEYREKLQNQHQEFALA